MLPQPALRARRRLLLPGGRPPRPDAASRARSPRWPQEAGATVVTGAEALSLEPAPDGVRVLTTQGAFVAGQVVLAAGAWTPFLTRGLGLRLPIEPAKGYSVDVDRPADFPEMPLYLGDAHVVLTPLGDALRLGSTLELSGWDMRVRPRRVAYLRAGGRARDRSAGGRPGASALARPAPGDAGRPAGASAGCPAATGSSSPPATACWGSRSDRSRAAWSRSWPAARQPSIDLTPLSPPRWQLKTAPGSARRSRPSPMMAS